MRLGEAHMRFSYADTFGGAEGALEPYERLIHDVMVGDRTLFTSPTRSSASGRSPSRCWSVRRRTQPYEPGSWGPDASDDLIDPRHWHLPSDHV